jgi:lipoyl(octanoyl) transferase
MKPKCIAYRLGIVEYETAWEWQKKLIQQRMKSKPYEENRTSDVVLLLEHPSIYTLGRGATMENVKFDPKKDDCKLLRVDRGGEVTYHGPGQLVVYPILDLNYHKKDLHWYLRQVEETVIRTLAKFDIEGKRVDGLTGVWVKEKKNPKFLNEMRKICAVGTHASKWITMHGFALNVTTDLRAFDRIIPCGIDDRAVTSIELFDPNVTFEEVEEAAIEAVAEVFNVDMTTINSTQPF